MADTSGAEGTSYDALADAKALLRTTRAGALATLEPGGGPFASLVSVATLPDGSPVLLLSTLAGHTRHLAEDPRCSLLLSRGGKGDPLAHARLTLTGAARRLTGDGAVDEARARFLRRQPKAALYADFTDFGFFVIAIEAAHLNGGFARAARFSGGEVVTATEGYAALIAGEADALAHLNADHADALRLYATVLCKAPDGAWRASGLDPEGLDLVCGDRATRLPFDAPVADPGALRAALVALAARARCGATAKSPSDALPDQA